ncbi:hypothetical protein [Flavobacterium capsici]|uniref:Uncharacterized protein n=1 Tax=Flavobacterium capsici TaxID=3075618 RepID=A0AA96F1L5_9FLAO|nr:MULTISPECIES: hypothetical protein [unclassified Flavobacterium]WNM19874.1 hypothetical protein RN608_04135 [Flavobacterium sp. PMR2A8]WNM21263.1 hypothetical protein RN605_11305 [Flavobacterium sp. PMTSA4]
MKFKFLILFILLWQIGFSQEEEKQKKHYHDSKSFYSKFELSSPLRVNQYAGEINEYTGEEEPWFLLDGISLRACIGSHYDKWIGIGMNIGIDWKANRCLVVAPLFGSLRLSPRITEDIRITSEAGYGRALSISGDKLSGTFKKISLGIEDEENGFGIYIELCQYGFSKITPERIGSFSVGLNYIMF